eukprot:15338703-Ditylum_brightwellii.AAC.1
MQYTFARLSLTCHDIFNFHVDIIPWDPQTTPPMNNIAMAYVATVSFHNTQYQKSTDNPTNNTPATSTDPESLTYPQVHWGYHD